MAASASVDAFSSMVGFARALRQAGIGVSSGQIQAFARAFEWLDPCSRTDIRHAARATLLCRREDAALFERVFDGFWLGVQPGQIVGLVGRRRVGESPSLDRCHPHEVEQLPQFEGSWMSADDVVAKFFECRGPHYGAQFSTATLVETFSNVQTAVFDLRLSRQRHGECALPREILSVTCTFQWLRRRLRGCPW